MPRSVKHVEFDKNGRSLVYGHFDFRIILLYLRACADGWRQAPFGTWSDTCSAGSTHCSFEGNMPGPSDEVYHYGPTRVWDKPIHSSKYGKSKPEDLVAGGESSLM